MRYGLCLVFLFHLMLFGKELSFEEKFSRAQEGDYLVAKIHKSITLIALRTIQKDSWILEEITLPPHLASSPPTSWKEWVQKGAPGHSSWSMVEIEPSSGKILECYSFSKSSWIHLRKEESFFATLLTLPLKLVPPEQQRKIGPPPPPGETDHRKVWSPPFTLEGHLLPQTPFLAYETHWPQDSSELSGKTLTLYFDQKQKSPFPYWVEVDTAHATGTLRAVDVGSGLLSPYTLPRRAPVFLGPAKLTQKGCDLRLQSPSHFSHYEVFAFDLDEPAKKPTSLPCSWTQKEERLTFSIPHSVLKESLQSHHHYRWIVIPNQNPHLYARSNHPFQYNKN